MEDSEQLAQAETLVLPEVSIEGVDQVVRNGAKILKKIRGLDGEILEYDMGIPAPSELIDERDELQEGLTLLLTTMESILPAEDGYWPNQIISETDKE